MRIYCTTQEIQPIFYNNYKWSMCDCACSVTKSCPTLWDPMDYSPPGSSVHGISQARILEGCHFLLQGSLPAQGLNLLSPALQADSLLLSHWGSNFYHQIKLKIISINKVGDFNICPNFPNSYV